MVPRWCRFSGCLGKSAAIITQTSGRAIFNQTLQNRSCASVLEIGAGASLETYLKLTKWGTHPTLGEEEGLPTQRRCCFSGCLGKSAAIITRDNRGCIGHKNAPRRFEADFWRPKAFCDCPKTPNSGQNRPPKTSPRTPKYSPKSPQKFVFIANHFTPTSIPRILLLPFIRRKVLCCANTKPP